MGDFHDADNPSESAARMDLEQLGRTIETRRRRMNLSAREVADAAGISAGYLRVLERGANPKTGKPSRASADVVIRIAQILKVDAGDLLVLAGYPVELGDMAGPLPARGAVIDLLRQVDEAARDFDARGPFFRKQIEDRLRSFTSEIRAMSQGTLQCKPEQEPSLTKLAIQKYCEQHLRAVSFHDERWWGSEDGDAYLSLHADLPPEVEMTRIFLAQEEHRDQLRQTFERHLELGIETYVVPLEKVPQYLWRDFVIYDGALLRRALSDEYDTPGKSAEFTDDPIRVQQALVEFNAILTIAKSNLFDAERILARMSNGAGA